MERIAGLIRQAVGALILMAVAGAAIPAQAQAKNQKKLADAAKEAQKASDVFTDIMNVREKAIPQSLLDKAEAIAVFPGVIKAGFIVGGRGGHGVISRRTRNGWSEIGRASCREGV